MSRDEARELLPGLYECRRELWEQGHPETLKALAYEVRGALKWLMAHQREEEINDSP